MSEEQQKQKKGRATPKRKEAEKKNFRPLVVSKKNMTREEKKALKARQREQRDLLYAKRRDALDGKGDPRYLPEQDKGEEKKFIRDYVDARWSFSEFLMPILMVFLLVSIFLTPAVVGQSLVQVPLFLMYGALIVSIVEVFLVHRKLKQLIAAKFGIFNFRAGFYTFSRMISIRAWRSPRPMVKRGEFPKGSKI